MVEGLIERELPLWKVCGIEFKFKVVEKKN